MDITFYLRDGGIIKYVVADEAEAIRRIEVIRDCGVVTKEVENIRHLYPWHEVVRVSWIVEESR